MKAALRVLALLIGAPVAANAQNREAPTVQVAEGELSGSALPALGAVFRGIPFAKAPLGELRWQAPLPPLRWKGVRPAVLDGAPCLQEDAGWNRASAPISSEDCLKLNVWTPRVQREAGLPVMVWIHGGAFTGGTGSIPLYDGSTMIRHGVILVTINYRLGALGFLAHPDLTRAAGGSSGNYGLQDQLAALRWVRDNIEAFGGDPSKVTIFGQSAGAISVSMLMTSPADRGLFQAAIAESGAPSLTEPLVSLADAETTGMRIAGGRSLAEMRALPGTAILAAARGTTLWPIIDGRILREQPEAVFRAGRERRVPLLAGVNSREFPGSNDPAELSRSVGNTVKRHAGAILNALNLGMPAPLLGSAGARWETDIAFRCPVRAMLERHAKTGQASFLYQFEQPLPGREAVGAAHTFEVPYVFGNFLSEGYLGGRFGDEDRLLSERLQRYWTNFAKRGDPNDAHLITWPQVRGNGGYVHLSNRGVVIGRDMERTVCSLIEGAVG